MKSRQLKNYLSYIILVTVIFTVVGGCDVDFGTDNNGNNNGGSDGGTTSESVEGTIVDVLPSRDSGVSNITADIMDEDHPNMTFSGTTGNTGFFKVEGSFSGTPQLDFIDEDNNQNSLARIIINVFPKARVKLGDIRLDSGNVVFLDDITVIFDADLIENDCIDNSGSVKVEASNGNTIDVLVQITNSTDLERDNDNITCNDLLKGQTLEISGVLLVGNSVEADRIVVQ